MLVSPAAPSIWASTFIAQARAASCACSTLTWSGQRPVIRCQSLEETCPAMYRRARPSPIGTRRVGTYEARAAGGFGSVRPRSRRRSCGVPTSVTLAAAAAELRDRGQDDDHNRPDSQSDVRRLG